MMYLFSLARILVVAATSCFFLAACGGGSVGGPSGIGPGETSVPNIAGQTATTSYGAGSFEGFGSNVTGGTGGTVVTVTNLNDSGAGSFRSAVSGSNRIVRFAVAGTINLTSTVYLSGPNVTVDGFSAPAPGITVTGASIEIGGEAYGGPTSKGSNILIQGLRFRNGVDDAVRIAYNAHDIVVDHNSFYAAGDGEVDVTEGAYNVTVSYNIFSKNNGPGPHLLSYDAGLVSYHHNLYYKQRDRIPEVTGGWGRNYSSGPAHADPQADFRYNIVWDSTLYTTIVSNGGNVATANVVSNLYWDNSGHGGNIIIRDTYQGSTPRGDAYVAGNVSISDCRGPAYSLNPPHNPYTQTSANGMNNHAEFTAPPITGPSTTDQPGRLAEWTSVKNTAGVISKFADDAIDSEARNAVVIPVISIFSAAWNNG
jgi:pectate lyase